MSTQFGQWTVYSAGRDNGLRLSLSVTDAEDCSGYTESDARSLYVNLRSAINHAWPHGPPLNSRIDGPPCVFERSGCLNQASVVCACGVVCCPRHAKLHEQFTHHRSWWEIGAPCRVSTE